MNKLILFLAIFSLSLNGLPSSDITTSPAYAQMKSNDMSGMDHSGMGNKGDMSGMDHSGMGGMSGMDNSSPSAKIINKMHMPMMAQPFQKSNNPDLDYIVNMIPHHQGAIDSAKEYLSVATDDKVRALATQIIKDQEKEIADFNMLIPTLKSAKNNYNDAKVTAFANQSEEIMNMMMNKMAAVEITNDPNVDFVMAMIPHHQAAIDSSKKVLEITKNDKIKMIAKNIIAAQEKEIKDMHALLAKMKKPMQKKMNSNAC